MARLQFEIPDERIEELDALLRRTGLRTRVQLFNAALSLFEWAVRQRESGRIIASIDERNGTYKELEMPGLPALQVEASRAKEAGRPGEASLRPAQAQPVSLAAQDSGFDGRTDLSRVSGIDAEEANLLLAAGVKSVAELAQLKPERLYTRLVKLNQEQQIASKLPTRDQLTHWVEQAKELRLSVRY